MDDSKHIKHRAAVSRSIRRAKVVISAWSYDQLDAWLEKAKGQHFVKWYKYRRMVEEAMLYRHP